MLREGVWRIDRVRGANSYLIRVDGGFLLVDSGLPGNADRVLEYLSRVGAEPSDVRAIVLTHADVDHMGSAASLAVATGAPVAIGAPDAPVLAGSERMNKPNRMLRAALAVMLRFMDVRRIDADTLLHDGDEICGFHVLAVPGHTPGSIALYRDDGLVISGDALLGDSAGRSRPPSRPLSADYDLALRSAERVRGLGGTLVLPGHGAPIFAEDPAPRS